MIDIFNTAKVKISGEPVYILEEVKFTLKQQLMEGPEGSSPIQVQAKVPVPVRTFRCRRFVPVAGNSQSRYETVEFTIGELGEAQ